MDETKLPKWTKELIKNLRRERDVAIRSLRDHENRQTKSRISHTENVSTGEKIGPSEVTYYIHARRIKFDVGKSYVEVGYSNHGELQIWADRGVVFIPESHNVLAVYPEERIIYYKNEK